MNKTALMLALCSATLAAHAEDGIDVDSKALYYDIHGATAEALLADMNRQAKSVGKDTFGQNQWWVAWEYKYDSFGPSCRPAQVRVHLLDRTTLPRWNAAGAPADLASRWQEFMTALQTHEKGHADHGLAAATEIRDAIRNVRAHECQDVGKQANRIGKEILDRYPGIEAQYDAETNHGVTQGAYWPRQR